MALKLKCPCGKTLSAPESAVGKRGKCPKCGMKFVVPDPQAKAKAPSPTSTPEPADDGLGDLGLDLPDLDGLGEGLGDMGSLMDEALDEPLKAREPVVDSSNPYASPQSAEPANQQSTRARMGTLANGIKLVFWGTLLIVLPIVVAPMSILAFALLGPGVWAFSLFVLGIAGLVGYVLAVIGRIMCLSVPEKIGAKGLIYTCVACDLIGVSNNIASFFIEIPPAVSFIASILGLATLILFVLFIKAVARFIGQEHLAEDARMVIIVVIVCMGSIFLIFVTPLAALLTLGSALYGVYKYLNLLQHTAEYVRP